MLHIATYHNLVWCHTLAALVTSYVIYILYMIIEFDFGEQRTMELMDKSTFPWLGSNIRHTKDGSLFHTTLDTDVFEVPTDGIHFVFSTYMLL